MLDIIQRLETQPHVPAAADIFRTLELTDFDDVRVVIVGQDPYTHGEATGLAFGVKEGHQVSGSLRTIQRSVASTVGPLKSERTDLTGWPST